MQITKEEKEQSITKETPSIETYTANREQQLLELQGLKYTLSEFEMILEDGLDIENIEESIEELEKEW